MAVFSILLGNFRRSTTGTVFNGHHFPSFQCQCGSQSSLLTNKQDRKYYGSAWPAGMKLFQSQSRFYNSRTRTGKEHEDEDEEAPKKDSKEIKKLKIKKEKTGNVTVFYDSLRIFTKAGRGGEGLPSKGGIGGKGGDVIAVGHRYATLKKVMELYPSRRFTAAIGTDARFFCMIGEPGKSVTFPVPLGVSIVTEFGHKLGEINKHGEKVIVAKGGAGGSPSNGFSANEGQSHNVTLDLKLIADVGFVGFPNAGKSTLLKAVSRASPKIASYPFTTIRPNVGTMEFSDFRQISLADLPGLIEGAHANIGMGHKFLKHVERTKILLFIVDIHGFQLNPQFPKRTALETIALLNRELELYREELTEKPAILALNKSDLPGSYDLICEIKDTLNDENLYSKFLKTLPVGFAPENLIKFDEVIPISAKSDPLSVNQLQKLVRKVIDINYDVGNALTLSGSYSSRGQR